MHEKEFEACREECEKRNWNFNALLDFARTLPYVYFCKWTKPEGGTKVRMFQTKQQCEEFAKEHNNSKII
jgi:hypothetical protein